MKEISDILARLEEIEEKAVLATVVDVKGSTYRLPGAKMLVLANGEFVGTVSGGCVEADVLERAQAVLDSNVSEVFLYDTTKKDESVFSLNMGCKGIVRVLLEPIRNEGKYATFLRGSIKPGGGGWVATAVGGVGYKGEAERSYFDLSGRLVDGPEIPAVRNAVAQLVSGATKARRPAQIIETVSSEYFVEFFGPPRHLLILGAGVDAIPLADLAHRIGWRVSVSDVRPAYANKERFPTADEMIVCAAEAMIENVSLEEDSSVVIMSHNYERDKAYLRSVFRSEARYVGVLGPAVRTGQLLDELQNEGIAVPDRGQGPLHAPVGLDIGASDPETIAVSILAEIQASFSGRSGGHLRDRKGSIYDR